MVEVFEPEEMGMCRSLFPFSPLLTHCSEETGSVGEPREKREERDGGGGRHVCSFCLCDGSEECGECVV